MEEPLFNYWPEIQHSSRVIVLVSSEMTLTWIPTLHTFFPYDCEGHLVIATATIFILVTKEIFESFWDVGDTGVDEHGPIHMTPVLKESV